MNADDLIMDIAARLYDGEQEYRYGREVFTMIENDYCSPIDMSKRTIISIFPYRRNLFSERISCVYDSTYFPDKEMAAEARLRTCVRVATEFVHKVLTKLDWQLKKEVAEQEIDNILSVLD